MKSFIVVALKQRLDLVFIVFGFLILSGGCTKRDALTEDLKQTEMERLIYLGFDTAGIVDMGEMYLVEGDIMIPKTDLATLPRQAIQNNSNLIDPINQQNITVRIDPAMSSDGGRLDWRNEVSSAIASFNAITNCNISFTLVTTATADITIRVGTNDPSFNMFMGPNVIAAAGLPSNGEPFHTVVINSNYVSIPSSSQKHFNLVHELGHCIGFRHTNWRLFSESGALGVGLSPNSTSNPDPSSVFNGGTAGNSWSSFSTWDLYAMRILYPVDNPVTLLNGHFNGQSYVNSTGFSFGVSTPGTYHGNGMIESLPGTTINVNLSSYPNLPYTSTITLSLMGGATFNPPYSGSTISVTDGFLNPAASFTMPALFTNVTWYLDFETDANGSAASGTFTIF